MSSDSTIIGLSQWTYFRAKTIDPILRYSKLIRLGRIYTDVLKNKIEMLQRRAARYSLNRYKITSSVGEMIDKQNWKKED